MIVVGVKALHGQEDYKSSLHFNTATNILWSTHHGVLDIGTYLQVSTNYVVD